MLTHTKSRRTQISNLTAALSTNTLSIELVETMRHSYKWQGSKQFLSSHALPIFESGIEMALKMHELTKEEKYAYQAFAFAEQSKAFTLLEHLQNTQAKAFADITSDLLEKEATVNRNIALYERLVVEEKNRAKYPDSSKINYWSNKLVDLKKSQDSLTTVFEKKYPDYFRLKYETWYASPDAVRLHLPSRTSMVEYFLTEASLIIFIMNSKGLQYYRQPIDSIFFKNIETFRHLVHEYDPTKRRSDGEKQADFQQFTQTGRALYKTLLEPALSSLTPRPSSLIIVPDGALGYLPFQALLTQDVENESVNYRILPYVVKDFNVRYEYSATLLTADWGKSSAPEGYLGVAPEYSGEPIAVRGEADSLRFANAFVNVRGGIPALMFNKDEVTACAEVFGGKPLIGAAATEADFVKKAKNYRILHLAMHALTNDADPLYSQLVFTQNAADTTDDNALHAYELYNMHLNADLAVLSACNTGAGKLVRGEGIMSLSRAFKYAGCPNILMSLWSVNDASAKDIVVDFLREFKAGKGKSDALQLAQKNYLKNAEESFTHPFYWATFVMVGDNEALPSGKVWLWWVAGFAVMFIAWIAKTKGYGRKKKATPKEQS